MAIAFGLVLALFSIFILVLPFIRGQRRGPQTSIPEALEEGRQRREAIYEEIKALRLEYELGRIDEDEYKRQHRTLRLQAANLIRDEELAENDISRLQQTLEEEIIAFRRSQGSAETGSRCLECGKTAAPGAELCSECKVGSRARAPGGERSGE